MPGILGTSIHSRHIVCLFNKVLFRPIRTSTLVRSAVRENVHHIDFRLGSMVSSCNTCSLLFVTWGSHPHVKPGRNKQRIWYGAERSMSRAPYCTVTPQPEKPQPSTTRPPSPTRCRETVKRKVALFIGYDGTPYRGFQRNAGVSTVSDALEHALHSANAISEDNFGFLNKIKWQVAARTDRGVGAVGNLVSAKLLFNRDELSIGSAFSATTDRVNAQLPPHVRLFGIQRITNSFNARSCCEARWYEYMFPMSVLGDRRGALSDLDNIMKSFKGSHYFHNYTVGAEHSLPPTTKARRYIIDSRCAETPVILDGDCGGFKGDPEKQFARILLQGQSFMMHQIRKMVSLAVLTYLGHVPDDAIARSFLPDTLINVPPVPPHGLFLDRCRFGWYNERHEDALSEPLDMNLFDEERERFKMSYLLPSISKRFQDDNSFDDYFSTVNLHPIRFD